MADDIWHPARGPIHRPTNATPKMLSTCSAKDQSGNGRLCLIITPIILLLSQSFVAIAACHKNTNRTIKVHRSGHSSTNEMKDMPAHAWARVIMRRSALAMPISHHSICLEKVERYHLDVLVTISNLEIQSKFIIMFIHGEKVEIVSTVDIETEYGERIRQIWPPYQDEKMMKPLESSWIHMYEAPKKFSADPKLYVPSFRRFVEGHNMKLCPRPTRSFYKNG